MKKSSIMGSSKYEYNPNQLNYDIERTKLLKQRMKEELRQATNCIYADYTKKFHFWETARDEYIEWLREELTSLIEEG